MTLSPHSLSSHAGRDSSKGCSAQTVARHEDPVLEKPQNGYRDASARVWKKVAVRGRLEPGAPRAPFVAATSARSYLASERSIQCSSGGIECELRAKWMGAPAAPAPTFKARPKEKRSAGSCSTRSAPARAIERVASRDPESTTTTSQATVCARTDASAPGSVLALSFVLMMTLARGLATLITCLDAASSACSGAALCSA